jgi:hypothetical protein
VPRAVVEDVLGERCPARLPLGRAAVDEELNRTVDEGTQRSPGADQQSEAGDLRGRVQVEQLPQLVDPRTPGRVRAVAQLHQPADPLVVRPPQHRDHQQDAPAPAHQARPGVHPRPRPGR